MHLTAVLRLAEITVQLRILSISYIWILAAVLFLAWTEEFPAMAAVANKTLPFATGKRISQAGGSSGGSQNNATSKDQNVAGFQGSSLGVGPAIILPTRTMSDAQKNLLAKPLLLKDAVAITDENYPAILKANAIAKAEQLNITVQKFSEYMPESLLQTQDFLGSRNKITEDFYGSPAFPAMAGPATSSISMKPMFFSGVGTSLDWVPLDFGLHRARIDLARRQYEASASQTKLTVFDAELAAASAYLDTVQALRQVRAAEENVRSFEEFLRIVDVQVGALLKPAVDSALSRAQMVNAQNQLSRARLNLRIAETNLANALGVPDIDVKVLDRGIADSLVKTAILGSAPVFAQVPVLQAANAQLLISIAQRRVLNREWDPVFHWLGGWQQRGGAVSPNGNLTGRDGYGLAPVTPNYQVALVMSWNFLDYFRLHFEKKVQDYRIVAQQQQVNLVLNNLKVLDKQSRAKLETAIAIAANMPIEVDAAESAQKQAVVRYGVGLSSVAQVAEANQTLALARMQEAIANVAVWRALLEVSSVHGALKPFLAESQKVQTQ